MKNHDPEFVRQRIQWCAKKHGMPFLNTGFWSEAPVALRHTVPSTVSYPVVFSMSDSGEASVIGVDEVLVIQKAAIQRIHLDEVEEVTSPCLGERKRKVEHDALELMSSRSPGLRVPTEQGVACFAFWNILLMLVRMRWRGE